MNRKLKDRPTEEPEESDEEELLKEYEWPRSTSRMKSSQRQVGKLSNRHWESDTIRLKKRIV